MISVNAILQGRYKILHKLGRGGMGTVYQGIDENLSCVVAVKETLADTNEQRDAFKREAELLAYLTHSALPRVMDQFTLDSGQFLVMQYVPGDDLAEMLRQRGMPFDVDQVLYWI
jgi:serine/threonine protein kinase